MNDLERRLERAKHHLDGLQVEVEQFMRGNSNSTTRGRDRKSGGYVLLVPKGKPVPPLAGLIAADFVHNLRALLDNLAWAVAKPTSLRTSERYGFPLFERDEHFREFAESVLHGMPRERIDAFERNQPYQRRPEDPANDRLRLLHQMWNADKHHAPYAVTGWAVAAGAAIRYGDDVSSEPPFHFYVGPLGKNSEVGWVSASGAKSNLQPRVTLGIGFKTRQPNLSVAWHALIKAYDIVAKEVLPDFRPFL